MISSRWILSSTLVNAVFMHRAICMSIYHYYKYGVGSMQKELAYGQVIDDTIKLLLMRRKRSQCICAVEKIN